MKKSAPRREMFPKEFLVDLNATKAAIRCGYSKKCARNAGARLMANANIKKTIRGLMEKRQERLEITAEKWLGELAIIGFSDIKNYITIDDGGMIVAKMFEEMPKDSSRALEVCEEIRTIKETTSSEKGTETDVLNSRVRFKTHSKLGALDLIGKHLGFLKDPKIDVTVSGNLSIEALKKSMEGYKKQ